MLPMNNYLLKFTEFTQSFTEQNIEYIIHIKDIVISLILENLEIPQLTSIFGEFENSH